MDHQEFTEDRRQTERRATAREQTELLEELINWKKTMKNEETATTGVFKSTMNVAFALVTAALLFAASFIYDVNKLNGTIVTRLEFMTAQVAKLEARVDIIQNNYVDRKSFQECADKMETKLDKLLVQRSGSRSTVSN